MINEFIEQSRQDEARGLLPEEYTEEMKKKMGVPKNASM